MKYRKKPVVIEAFQWTGDHNQEEDPEWAVEAIKNGNIQVVGHHDSRFAISLLIKTLEGDMVARKKDWIIKGVANEIYPCKPDIFEATYEPITPPNL